MIRFDLNMEHDKVYGKFVLSFDHLYLFNFVFLQKVSLSRITDKRTRATRETRGVVMRDIVHAFIVYGLQ